ncbi:pitrilysin family protein [Bradyrhizobium sp. ARR65]|uniref:M16 family metallopeptidase n=1 Tax=Bradyrhizobium sp. ARR65 TaxID=1040989 RepID=UPI001FD97A38|nr:pitrilysin family protein [Bradyrhizobium sp. ARR65]
MTVAPVAPAIVGSPSSHGAPKVQRLVSRGGIEAWFVQDATVPLIAMQYAFAGGSTQDPSESSGLGSMVARLLREGSGDLDSKSFHERLDEGGIELNFASTRDYLHGSLRILKHTKHKAFELLGMALTSPRFDAPDVERIQAEVLANLRHRSTDPVSIAYCQFFELAFTSHPYGRQPEGTLKSVQKIESAELKVYVRRVIAKDTLKIAVVGDIDAETLDSLLDSTFGNLPERADLTEVADVAPAKPPQRIFVPLDVPQTVLIFGGAAVRRSEPDYMATRVVNQIFGGSGLSSRLFREIRDKRGLAYSVHQNLMPMDHSALFVGSVGTRPDRIGETIEELERQVRRIAEEGPTREELDETKSYLKGLQMRELETSSALAYALLEHQLDKLPIEYIEEHNALIDAVRLEDAKRAAQRLWGQGLLTTIVGRAPLPAARCE